MAVIELNIKPTTMKVIDIKVDKIPSNCNNCMFKYTNAGEDDYDISNCLLKQLRGYDPFGIKTTPCPLDGKDKEL